MKLLLCLVVALALFECSMAIDFSKTSGRLRAMVDKKSSVTICQKLVAAKPQPKTAAELDTACDTYANSLTFYKDYHREKCKDSVAPVLADKYADAVAFDCDDLEDELQDAKIRWKFFREKDQGPDMSKRVGLEDELGKEMDASTVFLYNPNPAGGNAKLKFGPTSYGQVLTKTAAAHAIGTINLLEVTLDGIRPQATHGDDIRDALATAFRFDIADWGKDGIGTQGLIELVSGPVPNADIRLLLRALQQLLEVIGECNKCEDGYVGAPNIIDTGAPFGRAFKFEVVRTKFNALLVGGLAELAPFALEPLQTTFHETNLAGYTWMMKCGSWSFTTQRQNLQVNYGLPVSAYATDLAASLVPPLNGEESEVSKILKKCHSTTAAYLAASAMADVAKNNNQVKGLFALIAFLTYGNTLNQCKGAAGIHLTASQVKDYYNQLPKVNAPDVVRLLPFDVRAALKTWYVGNLDAITLALYNAMWVTPAPAARLPSPQWMVMSDPQKNSATACFNGAGDTFKTKLKRNLKKTFDLNVCPDRFVGEKADTYGSDLDVTKRGSNCRVTADIDKIVPAVKSNNVIWAIVEARRTGSDFNLQFVPKANGKYAAADFNINDGANSEIKALVDLQNA